MSARGITRPIPEVMEFRHRPRDRHLILIVAYQGRTFPIKIDLKWAGAGVSRYSAEHGCFMVARGRKGKPATEGATYWDTDKRRVGLFTATRHVAEQLISLLWDEKIILGEWPLDEASRITRVTLTPEAITFALQGYSPLRTPRGITSVWLGGYDPGKPLPRIRSLTAQVDRPEGPAFYALSVDTASAEGRAALAALGFPGYAPSEEVQPFHLAAA